MRAAFGGVLLAAAFASAPALAQRARTTTAARSAAAFHPVQLWGGLGYYRTSVSLPFGSAGSGEFGLNGGGSYAYPISHDFSALAFGNIALAFGDVNSYPITIGGGARFEHAGPVQVSGLAGLSIVPVSGGAGTKVGLGLGVQGNYPLPQVHGLGIQAAFLYHILSDSFSVWTINGGVSYTLPYL